ncbi:MAG TPA: tetratricopeptide repeat protein [Rhizomicrobium sp.]|nr:tetratricopeptide repeat protein [Rhizomicrobium sp.]
MTRPPIQQALDLHRQGRLDQAAALYAQILEQEPGNFGALQFLGVLRGQQGRYVEAVRLIESALKLQPQDFGVLANYGQTLMAAGRLQEALEACDQALAIRPDFFEAHYNKAMALFQLKRFAEAVLSFDHALALRPVDAQALNSRGAALWHLGQKAEARASYDRILAARPDHAEALLNRAFLLQELGDPQGALADYDKVLAIAPTNARAWNGRGAVLHALDRNNAALADFEKALELEPAFADALANRATIRWVSSRDQEAAVADLKAALAANPDQPYARGELLHLKMYGADWDDFETEKTLIDSGVRQGQRVVRPFVYQALSSSPADLQSCSRIFTAQFFPPAGQPPSFHHAHARIRIGYVSGEFREQATAYLMAGLYELHDRGKFEVIAIDNGGGDGSAMRRRLEAAFDRLLNIKQMTDAQAADRIRSEEIDILVNLNGYFGAPRMGVFARRAAPIQVNYLGFPATLGASYMDYILADRIVIPEQDRRFYDEQVVWLPHSYQVNDRKRAIAAQTPDRAALGLPETGFVFCNFNQSYKITPDVFTCWMRVLKSVEASVLWLLSAQPPFQANLRREAERQGIAPDRLIFAPSLPPDQHLARLKQADLFLDSLPYNAHTTASDALWAGVPLITCLGTSFPGRVAASLLNAIGLPDLVTRSMADYETLAVRLARDSQALRSIRRKLADNRLAAPLFDTDLFRKSLEAAYTTMWRRWTNGEPARGFAVDPPASAG